MARFENRARNALAHFIGLIAPCREVSPTDVSDALERGTIRKVLLIRPNQGLGDLLLATPILRNLKLENPSIDLQFLASDYNAIIVRHNPHLAKVWIIQKSLLSLIRLVRGLRAERFDLAIILFSNAPSFMTFLIARLSGAGIVWSYETNRFYDGANWSQHLIHVALPPLADDTPEHLKFSALVAPLLRTPLEAPEFKLTPGEEEWGNTYWKAFTAPDPRPTIGIFLGGNPDRPERFWKPEAWAMLARRLISRTPFRIVAILPPPKLLAGGGKPENDFFEEFSTHLGQRLAVFDEKGIPKAAAFLSHLKLHICPDGGLYHVSCAMHVPTLGLFVGTEAAHWKPPVPWAYAIESPDGTAESLKPEDVFRAIIALL